MGFTSQLLVLERLCRLRFCLACLGGAIAVALLPIFAVAADPATAPLEQDCVHLDQRFQTIDHFGASGAWTGEFSGLWPDEARNRLADLLFSPDRGIGLTMWRFNIGGGLNPQRIPYAWNSVDTFETAEGVYDWTRQPGQRWWIAAAKARGVPRILAFANSPPARLTRNGFTNCDHDASTTNLKPRGERQYARYLTDIVDHFRNNPDKAERVTFCRVAPINEPEWDWNGHYQEGNRASNDDVRRILIALHDELIRRDIPVPIDAIESGNLRSMLALSEGNTEKFKAPYGDYLKLFADPQLKPALDHLIGYHSYWTQTPESGLYTLRRAFHTEMEAHFPNFTAWQTECCLMERHRDLTMKTALRVARVIDADLTVAGVAGWSWWLAISNHNYKDGLLYTDWQKDGDAPNIIPSRLFWVLGNYSRFVRPGFRRVAIDSDAHTHDNWCGSAYVDPTSRQLVIVYLNWGDTPVNCQLKVRNGDLQLGSFGLTPNVTSDTPGDDLKACPKVSTDHPVTIPPRSVVTLSGALP
jgi:O-glycosyl hydrolase